jgi:peptide deformylase
LEIIYYPHPTLRHKSKPIQRVDAELRRIVREMFDLMYEAKGVGLAANQVDLPMRMFVVNLESNPDEGQEHVFINPVVSRSKGSDEKEEGCLSLPGLYGQVKRPQKITLNAYDLGGNELELNLDDLFARVVQHELDHLDGVLFVDRLSTTGELAAQEKLEEFEIEFRARRQQDEIPSDHEIAQRLHVWERKYC